MRFLLTLLILGLLGDVAAACHPLASRLAFSEQIVLQSSAQNYAPAFAAYAAPLVLQVESHPRYGRLEASGLRLQGIRVQAVRPLRRVLAPLRVLRAVAPVRRVLTPVRPLRVIVH